MTNVILQKDADNVRAVQVESGNWDLEVRSPEGVWTSLNHFTSDPKWWLDTENQVSVMGWPLKEWFVRD